MILIAEMQSAFSASQLPFGHFTLFLQVMECYIAGVVPLAGTWSAESCLAVRQLIEGKIVQVKLLGTEENGHVHAVDILLCKGGSCKVRKNWKRW